MAIVFLLAGCGAGSDDEEPRLPSPRPGGGTSDAGVLYGADPADPVAELRATCEGGGGEFDGVDCRCPRTSPPDPVLVFSGEARGCAASDAWLFNSSCAGKTGRDLKVCLRLGVWTHGSTRLGLVVEPVQAHEVTGWLRDVAPSLSPRIPATSVDSPRATILVAVGTAPAFSEDVVRIAFENQLHHPPMGSMAPPSGYVSLRASSLDALASALGDPAYTRTRPQLASTTSGEHLDDLAAATTRAMDRDFMRDARPLPPSAGSSCLDACELQRVVLDQDETTGQREAVVVDRYINGVRQNREVQLLSPSHRLVEGKVVFDLGDHPSLVYVPAVVRDDNRLITRVRVYDGSFAPLETSDFVLLDPADALDQVTDRASVTLGGNELAILSFESGYSLRDPATFSWILRGPFASVVPSRGASLLGWYRAETSGALEYARGFIPSHRDSPFADRPAGNHTYHVNSILRGSAGPTSSGALRQPRIVPLGSTLSSAMTVSAVRAARSRAGARVGSVSVQFPMNAAACRDSLKGLLDTGLLLVIGAGNDGRDVGRMDLCPQRLGASSPDVIVVGAAAGGRMEWYSNRGAAVVDIAAEGDSPDLADRGTSFAAPRVAYAAAQLAAELPDASNAQIRMALLLSADLSSSDALPVRSGGSLARDYDRARLALGKLVQRFREETYGMKERVPFSVALAVAKAVERERPDADVSRAVERRLDILIRNSVVCRDQETQAQCRDGDERCRGLLRALIEAKTEDCKLLR
ncbi:S8 family serine peptidase [Sorangium sp. So ce590]|uniref:S8 family serine peptidase n=1 Tax=Sorangium sp. So ce590 TaxID=3133317 RepID=UPI003F5DE1A4